MMPESFESLIPAKPEPKFKYSAEGAGRIKYKISPNLFSKENNLFDQCMCFPVYKFKF
jgi:hypothetical protein